MVIEFDNTGCRTLDQDRLKYGSHGGRSWFKVHFQRQFPWLPAAVTTARQAGGTAQAAAGQQDWIGTPAGQLWQGGPKSFEYPSMVELRHVHRRSMYYKGHCG